MTPVVATRSRCLRPADVARDLGVNQSKIIAWLKSGELRGIDVSLHRGRKPRWRIAQETLDAFLAATALVHDLAVVSRDEDGFRNTGVQLVNPFSKLNPMGR